MISTSPPGNAFRSAGDHVSSRSIKPSPSGLKLFAPVNNVGAPEISGLSETSVAESAVTSSDGSKLKKKPSDGKTNSPGASAEEIVRSTPPPAASVNVAVIEPSGGVPLNVLAALKSNVSARQGPLQSSVP